MLNYLLLNTEQLFVAYDYHSYFNGIMNLTNFVGIDTLSRPMESLKSLLREIL